MTMYMKLNKKNSTNLSPKTIYVMDGYLVTSCIRARHLYFHTYNYVVAVAVFDNYEDNDNDGDNDNGGHNIEVFDDGDHDSFMTR